MQRKDPKNWWWKSMFIVYVSQHPMLIGLTLSLWAVNHGSNANTQLGILDVIGAVMSIAGIVIAYFADTQLYNFMEANKRREKKVKILYTGLWRYSMHPNHFGENLYWFGLAVMAINVGETWV